MGDRTTAATSGAGKGLDGPSSLAMGAGDGRRGDQYFTVPPANAAGGKGRHDVAGVFAPAVAKSASQLLKHHRV